MTRNLFGQHGLEILPQSAISAISLQMRSSTRSLLSRVKESAQVLKFRSENKKGAAIMNMKLEVVIVPVSDVDRAKAFYEKLGFRLDIDIVNENFRGIQFTPPRSEASIILGKGVTSVRAGSAELVLAVDSVADARDNLIGRSVNVSEVFHYAG